MAVITERFWQQSALVARSLGLPDIARTVVPYPIAGTGPEAIARAAADAVAGVVAALTGTSTQTQDSEAMLEGGRVEHSAADEAEAQRHLHDWACTDGLPIITPTPARVHEMLAGADPDAVLGVMAPRMGVVDVGCAAVNAVMAGALPHHLPTIAAAVRAVCDPKFNLAIVQGTTHNAAPLLVVDHGPDDIASGTSALGPGHRANATIGRALRLLMINAGGGHPGAGDMATLGQPAKFTCVVAENVAESPFGPLSRTPAVTAIAVEGPSQVMFVPLGDDRDRDADRLIEMLVTTMLTPGSLAGMGYGGASALVLSPLHAEVLAAAGFDRRSLQAEIYRRAVIPAHAIKRLHGQVRGAPDTPDQALVDGLSSPAHLLVAVAGGAGTYSAVFRGLAAGVGHAVTAPIVSL